MAWVRRVCKGLVGGVCGLCIVYVILTLLLHLPPVQQQTGTWVGQALADYTGAQVGIGKVNLGFLNRIIIDDLDLKDPEGKPLAHVARLAVSLNPIKLLAGKAEINTLQLFGAKISLWQETSQSPLNVQFLLDAFSSTDEDKDKESPLNLSIRTLLVRGLDLRFDVLSDSLTSERLDPNHLHFSQFALTASLLNGQEDRAHEIDVKRLSFIEETSGLRLQHLRFHLHVQPDSLALNNLSLTTDHSTLSIPSASATLDDSLHLCTMQAVLQSSTIGGEDLTKIGLAEIILPKKALSEETHTLSASTSPLPDIHLTCPDINLQEGTWVLSALGISIGEDALSFSSHIALSPTRQQLLLKNLRLSTDALSLSALLAQVGIPLDPESPLAQAGPIDLNGQADLQQDGTSQADLLLTTTHGQLSLQATHSPDQGLHASLEAQDFDLQPLLGSDFGTTSFDLQASHIRLPEKGSTLPEGQIKAEVNTFLFKGYAYAPLILEATSDGQALNASLHSIGPDASANLLFSTDGKQRHSLEASITALNPHALGWTKSYEDEVFSGHVNALLIQGKQGIEGNIHLDTLTINTPTDSYHLAELSLLRQGDSTDISGDFIDLNLVTSLPVDQLLTTLQQRARRWMPFAFARLTGSSAWQHPTHPCNEEGFELNAQLTDSPLLRHLFRKDLHIDAPLVLHASHTPSDSTTLLRIDAPAITLDGTTYRQVEAGLTGDERGFQLKASMARESGNSTLTASLSASGAADSLSATLCFDQQAKISSEGTLDLTACFADANKIDLHILPSQLTVNDTLWRIAPADIHLAEGRISVEGLHVASSFGNRFLSVDGVVSENEGDSLIAQLAGIQIQYITDLVDFHAVGFMGDAYGKAVMKGFTGGVPNFSAWLEVPNFHFETCLLGHADIKAYWDHQLPGVQIDAHIVDYSTPHKPRITDCKGFVAPANDDIKLRINAQHTNAGFLNDYLGSIFSDIEGEANGEMYVLGPLGDISLVGDMSTNVSMRLSATGVRYHVNPHDTLRLRPYRFQFDNVRISDDLGGEGLANGYVSHRNVKNFAYVFDFTLNGLLGYEEHEFNADKFMGKAVVDGTLSINGSDGHPLYINVDCTPTPRQGSFFAYDAATPDAIGTNAFITFNKVSSLTNNSDSTLHSPDEQEAISPQSQYSGDIFMDIAIHLTPDIDIKLRMDNQDDGYITTQGTGDLQAHYHNKGPFTLQGTYNISSGSYRLYLQDLIFRDLSLQNGSSVVFNGNPFDAQIHLICHHTLHAVPLSDLTADATVTSTGRAKVICILDITGQLGNMALDFDYELPNETEETKQLVRSLVYTDEERNMQMVYLLALGRFYSSEYARATGQTDNSQAVNSLLTSTISGQINQMISSIIGDESNWNFGTGISTGDYGLEDLDIEGILSGRLFDDRLLINGNFGYRDNALTQNASFIGDFDLSWRLTPRGNTYLKAYNKANDRYFTKSSLNTQGIGISYQLDFENWNSLFKQNKKE